MTKAFSYFFPQTIDLTLKMSYNFITQI